MAIGRDAVAAVLLDLAQTGEAFEIEVLIREAGEGTGVHYGKRRRPAGPVAVPTLHSVTRAKLIDAAERLRRGGAAGVLKAEVDRIEASFRLVMFWTRNHRVIVRGRAD